MIYKLQPNSFQHKKLPSLKCKENTQIHQSNSYHFHVDETAFPPLKHFDTRPILVDANLLCVYLYMEAEIHWQYHQNSVVSVPPTAERKARLK